jgi:uncharacterized protein with ParB-like and HNH nuclease domain
MGSQFVIPVYQRNYTWNPEAETKRFMNDMGDLLSGATKNHFLGILIYMESDISHMFKQIQIVDGQQRLTTSFIFLLALKAIALEQKENDVAGMIDDYYLYNRHASEQAKLRLKPTVSDDDVYAKLVYGSTRDLDRRDKESNVYRNYDFIYQRIAEYAKKHSLLAILDTLGQIDLLVFPLSETDNAQQIFESINSTGAPLTSADLIRNYVLMNDTNEVQERNYKLYWQPLESYFPESRRLEEFFRYYLAAKTYNLLNRRDVYDGFKDYWNNSSETREERMREIFRYCRFYNEIYNGPAEKNDVEAVLKLFRYNESRVPAPFLMEMFRLEDDGTITSETLCKIIKLVDTYLMRRSLCGNDTNSLSRYFPQLLRSVMNSYKKKHGDLYEITKLFLVNYNRGKALAMPTNDQLKGQLREINAYSLMCIRPVLERIEHYGATAEVDTSNLNIEHIMPQHPNAYWKKAANAKDDDEYTFYVNLIGNLTLCAEYDNTRMGNQDFAFKKKVLSKTLHIRMNTEILQKDGWTPKDILSRCDEMAKTIIAIYPYDESRNSTADTRDDDIIVLSAPSVNAKALYHNPKSIEILSGSTMHAYGPQEMKSMKNLCRDIMAMGILSEEENGQIQFEKNYRFHDLNTAAQFLLHRGGDNVSAWTRENGTSFIETKDAEPAKEQPKPAQNHPQKQESKPKNEKAPVKQQAPKKKPAKQNQQPKKQQAKQPQPQQKNNSNKKPAQHSKQNHQTSQPKPATKPQPKQAAPKPVQQPKKSYSKPYAQKGSQIQPQKVEEKPAEKPAGNHFVEFLKTLRKK